MSYEYVLSITITWMSHFNTYNATYCEEKQEGNREN